MLIKEYGKPWNLSVQVRVEPYQLANTKELVRISTAAVASGESLYICVCVYANVCVSICMYA